MQCCVSFCENTSDNVSTSGDDKITFHKLPSEVYLHAAWLKALGKLDDDLPDPAVVCSQHFIADDFYVTKSCTRQIHSNAIPSTLLMCMMCLDTDSKLLLMSKHKLEEMYEQLTGLRLFQLCRRADLRPTLCVLCAQRLINFRRFRKLSLRAYSVMMDLVERHEKITKQHKATITDATKPLKCSLTQTTLAADHCDLYVHHTDEEELTAAEEAVVGDVASVTVKVEELETDIEESVMGDVATVAVKVEELETDIEESVMRDVATVAVKVEELETDIEESVMGDVATVAVKVEELETDIEESVMRDVATVAVKVEELETDIEESVMGDVATVAVKVEELETDIEESVMRDVATVAVKVEELETDIEESVMRDVATVAVKVDELETDIEESVMRDVATVAVKVDELETDIKESVKRDVATVAVKVEELETDIEESVVRDVASVTLKVEEVEESVVRDVATVAGKDKDSSDSISITDDMELIHEKYKDLFNNDCIFEEVYSDTCLHSEAKLDEDNVGGDGACPRAAGSRDSLELKNKSGVPRLTDDPPPSEGSAQDIVAPLSVRLATNKRNNVQATEATDAMKSKQTLKSNTVSLESRVTNCEVRLYDIFKNPKKDIQHNNPHIKTSVKKLYSCNVCSFKCAYNSSLLRHNKTHTGQKPFFCEVCQCRFAEKSNLLQHMRTHTGEKPYSCLICNYKSAFRHSLMIHIKTHPSFKPYSCEVCKYKCEKKSILSEHMKIHSGEKRYFCDMCNYKSTHKNYLVKHLRTHTGEKPYACGVCKYASTTKSHITRHMRTHTVGKTLKCEYKCRNKRLR